MEGMEFIDPQEWDDMPAGESRRRKMNIFYLIDTSGSMSGDKIACVNEVMPEVVDIVSEISDDNMDNAEICVSALIFDSGTRWLYPEALVANDFKWISQQAGGGTSLGGACLELEKALHRKGDKAQLVSTTGHKNPAIILLSDGEPTDNYKSGLEKLKSNKWFESATKVAFQIGGEDDNNIDNLIKFTGNKEMIIKVNNPQALKKMLTVVTAVVSKVGTQSASVKSNGEQITEEEEIIKTIDIETQKTSGAAAGEDILNLPPFDDFD